MLDSTKAPMVVKLAVPVLGPVANPLHAQVVDLANMVLDQARQVKTMDVHLVPQEQYQPRVEQGLLTPVLNAEQESGVTVTILNVLRVHLDDSLQTIQPGVMNAPSESIQLLREPPLVMSVLQANTESVPGKPAKQMLVPRVLVALSVKLWGQPLLLRAFLVLLDNGHLDLAARHAKPVPLGRSRRTKDALPVVRGPTQELEKQVVLNARPENTIRRRSRLPKVAVYSVRREQRVRQREPPPRMIVRVVPLVGGVAMTELDARRA
jgi:ribosomal protein L21